MQPYNILYSNGTGRSYTLVQGFRSIGKLDQDYSNPKSIRQSYKCNIWGIR